MNRRSFIRALATGSAAAVVAAIGLAPRRLGSDFPIENVMGRDGWPTITHRAGLDSVLYFKPSPPATMTLEGRDEHGNPMSVELLLTDDWTEVPGMRVVERLVIPAASGPVSPVIGPLDG